jgi:CRP-like cAMP-binding protein
MPHRDFFAFSTSLRPVELRALGTLSHVRHLAKGEIIYRAGDLADALYIINRGVVEILPANPPAGRTGHYLTRGDMFGDVELLGGLPRKHIARTCESLSLQCFYTEDLPELLRRVPSFFRYLSEQLAIRLVAATEAANTQNQSLELGGSLANFDLATIYQTITNSSQTGELSILNEQAERLGVFFFEAGNLRGGHFEHLTGEEAFWQLFLTEDLHGMFSFSSGQQKPSEGPVSVGIVRQPSDLLITALQFRDELQALKETLPDRSATLVPKGAYFDVGAAAPPTLRPLVEQIWHRASHRRLTIAELYPIFFVCELQIYQALNTLQRTGHLDLTAAPSAQKVA